ncbi:uncharacterized protein FTOL_13085 [Fusarium torulosum]|uniref:F-box domain-containing protein n=1 Tax=Fusarium torulosum TaxID=33205 RepID=A0AAE8MN58_9HYPO|nr:uncharacterized protein FTOL_13085 [Fusarium torulosum]
MNMDRDVSTLIIGTFSGSGRDEFGREPDKRRSLLLDTVMEGRARASQSRLLQIPAEILADIIDLLSDEKSTLSSLALVNSDCRQLARCCQFAEVEFDYSRQAQQLFLELACGALAEPQQPTIAACIRRVTFASRPQYVAQHHRDLYESVWGEAAESFTQDQRETFRKESGEYYTRLRKASMLAIAAMPNLETLIWKDDVSLDWEFFEKITRSKAQHVKLNKTTLDEPWSMKPPLTPSSWPIRSLDLNISLAFEPLENSGETGNGTGRTNPMTNFFSTLFQLCSPTLESLAWTYMDFQPRARGPVSLGDTPISFPRLQHLQLGWLNIDSVAISSFLAAPLKSLDLPDSILADAGTHLPLSGYFRDLESFVVSYLPKEMQACLHIAEFIIHHNDIYRLYIHERCDALEDTAHLNRYIVPALMSHDFSNLRSLSLAWGGGSIDESTKPHDVHVSETALAIIGRLVSLEKLSLCAGYCFGWRHQWLVNHEELRRHFSELKGLKMLALVRDTYPIPLAGFDVEQYYVLRFIGEQERIDAGARPELDLNERTSFGAMPLGEEHDEDDDFHHELWERAHRNRMIGQAESYAAILPRLEWIFCGQRPMGFKHKPGGSTTTRIAVPLTKVRDECYTFLQSTFRGSHCDC